jgi:rifampin ADP-ribosylating transferase
LPRSDQEILVSRIPGSRLIVYPDTGHVVLWECPEQVAVDLIAFLEAL